MKSSTSLTFLTFSMMHTTALLRRTVCRSGQTCRRRPVAAGEPQTSAGQQRFIDTNIILAAGSHNVVVQAWQTNGTLYKKSLTVNSTAPANGITIAAPSNGQNVGSSMHVVASATSSKLIDTMHLYVDDQLVYSIHSGSMDTTVPLSAGSHFVVIQAWDSAGTLFKTPLTVSGN